MSWEAFWYQSGMPRPRRLPGEQVTARAVARAHALGTAGYRSCGERGGAVWFLPEGLVRGFKAGWYLLTHEFEEEVFAAYRKAIHLACAHGPAMPDDIAARLR